MAGEWWHIPVRVLTEVGAVWVVRFPAAALRADDFAVTSFTATSFNERAFAFFFAPVTALEGIREEGMSEMTTHPHLPLYSHIHLAIAVYLVKNQLGFQAPSPSRRKRLNLVAMAKSIGERCCG
jgi:hypothetical protein